MKTMEKNHQDQTALLSERISIKPPSLYKVIIINDDYTTCDFVVYILERIFSMSSERAEKIMFKSHYEGLAICGVYSLEIAETKAALVLSLAIQEGFPLRCVTEEM